MDCEAAEEHDEQLDDDGDGRWPTCRVEDSALRIARYLQPSEVCRVSSARDLELSESETRARGLPLLAESPIYDTSRESVRVTVKMDLPIALLRR